MSLPPGTEPLTLVIKFGSGVLARLDGLALDDQQIDALALEVVAEVEAGHRCVLVSSGAVAAGAMELGLGERPGELATLQACSAIGQSLLMKSWDRAFRARGVKVAQLLLTHSDLDSRIRYNNARHTVARLLDLGVVPIINENDSVAVEELRFGDNDHLSAEVAVLSDADLLVMLTSVDGLTRSPDGNGEVLTVVENIDAVRAYAGDNHGARSVGGMATKLQAVERAVTSGIEAVIGNGRTPGVLAAAIRGDQMGTRFPAQRPKETRQANLTTSGSKAP